MIQTKLAVLIAVVIALTHPFVAADDSHSEVRSKLVRALTDADAAVRERAAYRLGVLQWIGAIKPLTERLRVEKDERVRWEIINALGRFGDGAKASVPILIEIMKDPASLKPRGNMVNVVTNVMAVRTLNERAALTLSHIGVPAAAPLADLLGDRKLPKLVRLEAGHALVQMESDAKAVAPALATVLSDPDDEIRSQAIEALRAIGPGAARAVPALTRVLDDSSARVRLGAASALFAIDPKNALTVPRLVAGLREKDARTRWIATTELERVGPKAAAAVGPLIEVLKEKDPENRVAAARALGAIGRPAREAAHILAKVALEDSVERVREAAAEAAAQLRKQE